MKPEDQKWTWRCKGCGEITELDGRGGELNCSCPEPQLEDGIEFKTNAGGRWGDGKWHPMSVVHASN